MFVVTHDATKHGPMLMCILRRAQRHVNIHANMFAAKFLHYVLT